ncbi:hypothetical protein EFW58_02883 [Bacillus velezensis]|nr:hypothetical protein EFW58_02883 [Bacillus velezensis]
MPIHIKKKISAHPPGIFSYSASSVTGKFFCFGFSNNAVCRYFFGHSGFSSKKFFQIKLFLRVSTEITQLFDCS